MSFLQDLQYGWRNLARTPGFLAVAVLSLALGFGANTALFSLTYGALYKTLPVHDPERLIIFNDPSGRGMGVGSSSGERDMLTWPEFQDLHKVSVMSGLFAAQTLLPNLHIRVGESSEKARGKMVSGAYFSVLQLQPQIGRFFEESVDNQIGSATHVVLSDGYWTRRFGRNPSVIGSNLVIRNTSFDIIGVAPRGFVGENVGQNPDFWMPISMQAQVMPGIDCLNPMPDPTMKVMWLHVFGRLKPGANLAMAQTQANIVFKASLEQSYQAVSPEAKKGFLNQRLKLRPASTGASGLRDRFAQSMFVIFAAVVATLLICCANISNLLLARATARQREITVRLALGASKLRVARQLFTEGLLLSMIGAGLGLVLSQAIAPLLLRMASSGDEVIYLDGAIDWRVMAFTGSVAVATTVICSLVSSLRAARTELMSTLREGGRGMTASRGKLMAGRMFVGAQIALSLIMLVSAGLFLRTLVNLQNVNLGYSRDRLAIVNVDASGNAYSDAARSILFRRVLDKFRSLPDVARATFSQNGLFANSESADQVLVEGYTPTGKDDRNSRFDLIGPGYFSGIGIPILQGREIEDRDSPDSTAVCVINDAFAKKYFVSRNPIGKHVTDQYGDHKTVFEIVGVARDSRDHSLRDKVPPRVFASLLQGKYGDEISRFAEYEVRLNRDSGTALADLKNAVLAVDRSLEVETRLLARSVDERVAQERLVANLVALFGLLALALAAIGIYGILAYAVSQRTNEIGLRMAIGAGTREVVGMIARETVWLVSGGVAVGLVTAYFLTRLVESKLFGVTPTDPGVLVGATAILGLVGFVAATLPALRASRIDPAIALRSE